MGGMHCWMWGEMYPGFMDALVPIASQPIEISGRNWIGRRIAIEAIRRDPDWNEGNYTKKPTHYIYTAPYGALMTENPVRLQELGGTQAAADALYEKYVAAVAQGDANDQLYATEAVIGYNPAPELGKITARLLAINFADDEVNPPELGVVEPAIRKIKGAQFVLVPASKETHGHFTHLRAAIWKPYLAAFLKELNQQSHGRHPARSHPHDTRRPVHRRADRGLVPGRAAVPWRDGVGDHPGDRHLAADAAAAGGPGRAALARR